MSSAAVMSDDEIKRAVFDFVTSVDLETTGLKKFIKLLSGHLAGSGGDKKEDVLLSHLKSKSDFIKAVLTEAIDQMQHDDDGNNNNEEEEEDAGGDDSDSGNDDDNGTSDGSDEEPKKKIRGVRTGGGLAEPKPISNELAQFMGLESGAAMARKDIVKHLWSYIREHDLQNPSNKREILLDGPMQRVFGCEAFTMFTMNKYIGAHVHPFKPVDLTTNSSTPNRKGTPKRKAASASRTRGNRSPAKSSSAKKPRKAGTQPPYRLSEELQAVVQVDVLPRPQVVSKLWEYIKANQLQNPSDKREILCDAKLKKIFQNKSKVTMFNMNQFLSNHLLEKVDRSEYVAATAEDDEKDDEDDGDRESDE
jgi:upstream activation factor subunit UAF30